MKKSTGETVIVAARAKRTVDEARKPPRDPLTRAERDQMEREYPGYEFHKYGAGWTWIGI